MTSETKDSTVQHAADDKPVERHYRDIAPVLIADNAADVRARGVADRMWDKVEVDLEKIDLDFSEGAAEG